MYKAWGSERGSGGEDFDLRVAKGIFLFPATKLRALCLSNDFVSSFVLGWGDQNPQIHDGWVET